MSQRAFSQIIVLKTIKYSESDLIVHGLNEKGEKLTFIAKGALRSKKRFGSGVLEPTHYIHVNYTKSQNEGGLNMLNEATLLKDFSQIRSEYERLEMAFYFLRLVNQVSLEGSSDSSRTFNLLGHSLRCLETTKSLSKLKTFFETKLLQQQGVLPSHPALLEIVSHSIRSHEQLELPEQQWLESRSMIRYTMQKYLVGTQGAQHLH